MKSRTLNTDAYTQLEDPFAIGTSFDAIDIGIETQSLVDRLSEDCTVPTTQDVIEGAYVAVLSLNGTLRVTDFPPNPAVEWSAFLVCLRQETLLKIKK